MRHSLALVQPSCRVSQLLRLLYGAKDSETVDEDNQTGAKVIETGVTKLMRLEYSSGLRQS